MKIAFIIYEGLTTLDFIGVYDPVTRLRTMGFLDDLEYDVCAFKGRIKSFEGLEIVPNKVGNSLADYDYLIIPGGNGLMDLIHDKAFLAWMGTIGSQATLVAVCGGALVLGVLGALQGKKATTHLAFSNFLSKFTEYVSKDRIVEDGNVITARGVTSAIDLGLYLCERIAGREIREKIQQQMDYLNYTAK